ncbi:MAG: phage capsid family protein [Bryobacterales bacterium]|nr:phage capsid family protein [Bryobacterales bacterium]
MQHGTNENRSGQTGGYRREPTANEMIGTSLRLGLTTADKLDDTRRRLDALEQGSDTGKWRGFGEYLGAVRNDALGRTDPRLLEFRASSGLNGNGDPSEGGFMIPAEYSDALTEMVQYSSPLASRCMRLPATQRSISLPAIDETSRAEGSRWGGVQSYWANEGDTVTAKKPKFRRLEMSLNKLIALVYVSDEVTESGGALGAFVANAFAAEGAYVLDSMISAGNGAGQPLGILNSPALITAAAEGGQTAATISPANITAMVRRLLPECFDSAVFIVSPELLASLYTAPLIGGGASTASNLFTPPDAGAPRGRLMTIPIVISETANTLGAVGDIVLASLPYYVVYEKPLDLKLSLEVRFINGEGVYRFSLRVDGQPLLKSAITPKNGGLTKSAFVTLAARP